MIGVAISLLAVMLLSFGLWKIFDIKSGATPLVSLSVLICIVIFSAMLGQLKAGVYISYAVAVIAFVISVLKKGNSRRTDFFSLPVLLFVGTAIFMLCVLQAQKPMMSQWDEFSFWGTAAKLIKERGRLYTFYKSSMIGSSMPPALPVLCYYFGYGFAEFCEWARFYSYSVLFLAAFSAIISVTDRENRYITTSVFAAMFLLPYFFGQTEPLTGIATMYVTVYSEVPLACLFAGVVAIYMSSSHDDERCVIPVLPVIAFLTFAKDMGLALSCIALFIIFWDMVASKEKFTFMRTKGLVAKVLSAVTMLFTTGAPYLLWAAHMSRVMQRSAAQLGGESNMGAVGLLVSGVKELLGLAPRSEKFATVMSLMIKAFFNTKISMIGSGAVVCAVIFALFAAAFVTGGKAEKIQVTTMYISSLIGFVGYYVFHLFLYVYIFKDNAYELTSYNRYIYPYYMAWMIFGIIALCISINKGNSKIGTPILLAFTMCVALCFARNIKPQNTFMAFSPNVYTKRITIKQQADFIADAVNKDDVIFLLSEEDSGQSWFMYTYQLTDNLIYQEPYIPLDEDMENSEKIAYYQKELTKFMREKNITHFMVDYPSDRMCEYIGGLFDVNMGQFGIGSVGYYKVLYTDDSFYCQLVKGTGIN